MTEANQPARVLDPQKEALVSLITLLFIEEHHLLAQDKLEDARNSLQALFLRTSGEETLLRKLIDILKTTQGIQRSFAKIASILDGIRASAISVETKISALRTVLEDQRTTAEENAAFVGSFLSFSQELGNKIGAFARSLEGYLQAKEEEARITSHYMIAREARDRLKQRLASGLGAETHGEVETRIKKEVVSSFDFTEAESSLKYARRESRAREQEVNVYLMEIRVMCQQAMNPSMREKDPDIAKATASYDDVFSLFAQAIRRHPRLLQVKNNVIELLKMYQRTYGMFTLDFEHLNQSITTMLENPDTYFESKDEDRDIRTKREKLRQIEGLIPFLERTAELFSDEEMEAYMKFSRRVSNLISLRKVPWEHIAPDLLRAKVQAEAELSTQM
jgi:hypothetical protein